MKSIKNKESDEVTEKGMREITPATPENTGRRGSEELEVRTSNGPGGEDHARSKVGGVETGVAPYPGRLHANQRVSGQTEVAACPWRVQPCREKDRLGPAQRAALHTGTIVTEAV